MTLYRATLLDTPEDPFVVGRSALRVESDGALLVRDGRIVDRGGFSALTPEYPEEPVTDLRDGVLLPGLVDTHVHYPQIRVIAGLGLPLLDWLEQRALPEEVKLADNAYARAIAREFLHGLASAGTTTALVFGAHFATAMDEFFAEAAASGLRIVAGQVLSDRILRPELLTDPSTALREGRELIARWHGRGRLRYAVTPRFSLSASDAVLDVCAELLAIEPTIWFTSHVNENIAEVARVADLFPGTRHYLDTYARHGLVTSRSVFAHNVHATDSELDVLAANRAWVAHCPTSNAALGSGMFPLLRHVAHGARVALGSDVGGGTGFSLFKEALQAYFIQQLLGPDGLALTPAHLLFLATRAGAQAVGLGDRVGDFQVGRDFDAVWLRPVPGSTLATVLPHARDDHDALARIFALATSADVGGVWVAGEQISRASSAGTVAAQVATTTGTIIGRRR